LRGGEPSLELKKIQELTNTGPGALKIYVPAVEALRKTERGCRPNSQFTTKIDGFSSFTPYLM